MHMNVDSVLEGSGYIPSRYRISCSLHLFRLANYLCLKFYITIFQCKAAVQLELLLGVVHET